MVSGGSKLCHYKGFKEFFGGLGGFWSRFHLASSVFVYFWDANFKNKNILTFSGKFLKNFPIFSEKPQRNEIIWIKQYVIVILIICVIPVIPVILSCLFHFKTFCESRRKNIIYSICLGQNEKMTYFLKRT